LHYICRGRKITASGMAIKFKLACVSKIMSINTKQLNMMNVADDKS
jgi:hypothetical protein